MPTINSATPTPSHRGEFLAAFDPGQAFTGNTTLSWPAAAGVYFVANSGSALALTLPTGSIPIGARIHGMNIGAGALSFAASGGEAIQMDPVLPSTVSQWSAFELRRSPGNVWVRVA